MRDGTLFIRPTHRASRVNLKKSDHLVPLTGGKVELEGIEYGAGTYGLQADKYGWFALTPNASAKGKAPTVKVS
jgi:hypothetical protein